MIIPRSSFRLGALLALGAITLAAQTGVTNWDSVKAVTPGTQVRITAGPRTLHGKLDRVADDALTLTSGKGQEVLDRRQVSVVAVEKPGHRKRNTLIGLAVGTGVGLGIGIAARSKTGQIAFIPNSAITAGFTAAGALGGAIVGVVIPSGGWREIYKK